MRGNYTRAVRERIIIKVEKRTEASNRLSKQKIRVEKKKHGCQSMSRFNLRLQISRRDIFIALAAAAMLAFDHLSYNYEGATDCTGNFIYIFKQGWCRGCNVQTGSYNKQVFS